MNAPFACPLAIEEGKQQCVGDVDTADRVGQNRAEQAWRAVLIAGDLRETTEGINRAMVADVVAPGAGSTECTGRKIDQARIELAEGIVTKPQFVHGAGREILGDDVALGDQPF